MFIQPDTVPLGLQAQATTGADQRTRPEHIGLVLGGHRQWSNLHQLPKGAALARAMGSLLEIVHYCMARKTRRLTLFVFRDDIWPDTSRHNPNVAALTLRFLKTTLTTLNAKGVRIRVSGDFARLHDPLRTLAVHAEEITAGNTGMELVFAIDGHQGQIDAVFADPPVELLVRTGGHLPVDHPMLWDTAETALYVTELSWPELGLGTFRAALEWFRRPDRGVCSLYQHLN